MSFDGSSQVGIVSNTSPNYNQPSLPVSQIRRDGGTQVRIAQNQFTIDEYAEILRMIELVRQDDENES